MHAPATVAAYLAYPCTRTDLQVRMAKCLMGIKKAEYEANNESKSKEQEQELMEALIWDMATDITLDLDDDASLHDLAMIHHLLAIRVTKQKNNSSTEPSEGSTSSDWLRQGTCLAHNSGKDGHVCKSEHLLDHAERAASPIGTTVWKVEHVR